MLDSVPPPPRPRAANAPSVLLFEASWEVCNQVGGIYQVLRSKSPTMMEAWGDNYCLLGPFIPDQAATDFEEAPAPGVYAELVKVLAREGVVAHFGHWLVSGRPQVLLLEYPQPSERLNQLKHELWHNYQVESPPDNILVDNAISFGHVCARLVAAAVRLWCSAEPTHRVLAHFHEWQGGVAIPLLRRVGVPVATLFTTHATLLGRYVASSSDDLYVRLPKLDPLGEAEHFGVKAQHQLERLCAEHCGIFTTVSPITGEECYHLLGRKPDVITPNGINTDRYDVGHEFQTLHAQYQRSIRRFVMGHFFPSYSFDLDKCLFLFTSGRFEPHNKGFDLCLDAMALLNQQLKEANVDRTIIFFVVTQQPVNSLDPHAMSSRAVLEELRDVSRKISEDLADKLFMCGAGGEAPPLQDLVDEYWMVRFRRTAYALRSHQLPLSTTHVLRDEDGDPVLQQMRRLGLNNAKDDRVKVIYHPQFINSVNPLFRLEYDQFVRGCHLGVFPSSYEPWGYTPLECVCMGVPAITSDMSGFGRYLADVHPDHDRHGMTVLGRRDQGYRSSAKELTNRLLAFCRLNRRQRIALRNSVEAHSRTFDWSQLGAAYHKAHRHALVLAEAQLDTR